MHVNFDILQNKTLKQVVGCEYGSETVVFETEDGDVFRMFHSQNCCESVSLEDVCGDVRDLIGSPIVRAEVRSNVMEGEIREEWTFYELATIKGSVTLRWYGVSNGYYSTAVSFDGIPQNY